MLYKLMEFWMSISSWTMSHLGLAMLGLILVAGLSYALPSLLRILVMPFLLLEVYFMSPSFACGGSLNMFSRAVGTQHACNPLDYNQYVASNFGLSHWYVVGSYAAIILFMVWPVLKKMAYSKDAILKLNDLHHKSSTQSIEKMRNIERIGNI